MEKSILEKHLCYVIRRKHSETIFYIPFTSSYYDFYYDQHPDLEEYLKKSKIDFEHVITHTKKFSYSYEKDKICISKRI